MCSVAVRILLTTRSGQVLEVVNTKSSEMGTCGDVAGEFRGKVVLALGRVDLTGEGCRSY